jgi:two-component system nitrate/nitrite response regulator NarL
VGQRALLREGLAALLHNTPYKVIANASCRAELKEVSVPAGRRTLVIIGMDDANGNEAAETIHGLRATLPDSRIVVVAEMRGPFDLQKIATLADGYVANLGSRDILLKVLELALLDQRVIVVPRLTPMAVQIETEKRRVSVDHPATCVRETSTALAHDDTLLSQREREILYRLPGGDSNKEIARLFNITESTVKVHLKSILRKIAAHNRTQAAIWAIERGYCYSRSLVEAPKKKPNSTFSMQILTSNSGNGASSSSSHESKHQQASAAR